ncbi:preprotein translocase subunit SecE [Cellulomonas rhizosphaerae]|uniref:Protein translocase subunit SecE n=1 Tax=Cellulomonas rhizosphaerae TaxID=2293719 RepID=A0A413RNZ4_9CELL|nr:preprotein translocase subunit SecE [Cellulomonas rhizosphaerae]RHA43739.1 preprotein translocase subunit SecE [Cellulomonas rhizosphaerae]
MSETAASAAPGADAPRTPDSAAKSSKDTRKGLFARIALFWRQVVSELKKVVRPTRSELVTYTSVVLVFVAVVMAFVTVVDIGIGKLTLWMFG